MKVIQDLRNTIKDFESTPESRGLALRTSLAVLVLHRLKEKGWSQKQLAESAGMKESFISRIIYANSNCTFDVAGRILFALDVTAEIVPAQKKKRMPAFDPADSIYSLNRVSIHGDDQKIEASSTGSASNCKAATR